MERRTERFRSTLKNGDRLVGTFMKTPSAITAEVLGLSSLDLICLDAEHAPFGRIEVDRCIAALRAADMPSLVRVPGDSPHDIRNALDCGASGVLVPHVTGGEQAAAIVKAAQFGEGGRGYAGSPRAAAYGTRDVAEHLAFSREHTSIIVQIEDIAALSQVEAIAGAGVDAVFIGRVDLAVAMGGGFFDPDVIEQVRRVCEQARKVGTTVGMFVPDPVEIPGWIEVGASLFLLSSDQSLLLGGANALAETVS